MDKQVRELHAVLVVSYRGTWIETNIGRELIHVHNRRTRKGCDSMVVIYIAKLEMVSIHAPVKDATLATSLLTNSIRVSIHAPVKDATKPRLSTQLT